MKRSLRAAILGITPVAVQVTNREAARQAAASGHLGVYSVRPKPSFCWYAIIK